MRSQCAGENDAGQTVCDFGATPKCGGADGDATCAALFGKYVKGEGEVVVRCAKNCGDGQCNGVCVYSECGALGHGCDWQQICVKRPGRPEACETPCAPPP